MYFVPCGARQTRAHAPCAWWQYHGGYFIDGDRDDIKWIDGSVGYDGDAAKCEIWADIYGLSDGEHKLTFVVELENGVIPIVDTCTLTYYNEKQTEPEDIPTSAPLEEEQTELTTEVQSEPPEAESGGCGASVEICVLATVLSFACGYTVKKNKKKA